VIPAEGTRAPAAPGARRRLGLGNGRLKAVLAAPAHSSLAPQVAAAVARGARPSRRFPRLPAPPSRRCAHLGLPQNQLSSAGLPPNVGVWSLCLPSLAGEVHRHSFRSSHRSVKETPSVLIPHFTQWMYPWQGCSSPPCQEAQVCMLKLGKLHTAA